MKRPVSTPAPAAPRKRGLSEDDRVVWESVAKQIKPLRKKPRLTRIEADQPAEKAESAATARKAKVASAPKPAIAPPRPPSPPPLTTLGRREKSRIARGRKNIDARLDLHGMTQARAHRALSDFLHRAHGDGCALVLVITGKGRTTGVESERGILRKQVPQWLGLPEFRNLVVGFDAASIGHGGVGALYVRLRRSR